MFRQIGGCISVKPHMRLSIPHFPPSCSAPLPSPSDSPPAPIRLRERVVSEELFQACLQETNIVLQLSLVGSTQTRI